jgi:chondroitin AC lyase
MLVLILCLLSTVFGDDITVVTDRVKQFTLMPYQNSVSQDTVEVTHWIETLLSDGHWPDVDYTDQGRALWKTNEHLVRVQEMAALYAIPNQSYYKNETLFSATSKALDYWLAKDFINPNWWWNEISVPQSIGQIVLLLSPNLNENQTATVKLIMSRANWNGFTGQNVVWMAYDHVLNGCYQKNASYVNEAFQKMWAELIIEPGEVEGIKNDGIFFQHGPQIYSGGYGSDFVESIASNIAISAGTSFAPSANALAVFSKLVLDGQKYTINPKTNSKSTAHYDYSVSGREITRPGGTVCNLSPFFLSQVPGPRASEFKDFASWLQTGKPAWTGSHVFWKGDYVTHRASRFDASVRMFSTRTLNSECVNDEGKLSLHMADGVTNYYVSGSEYYEIYPTWDWQKIPGISCEQNGAPLECTHVQTHGTTDFVGGVTDGNSSIGVFDFRAPFSGALTAKKSWFFLDNFVVALGAGLNCATKNLVVTSLNQCLLNSPVYTSQGTDPLQNGVHRYSNLTDFWVYQDSVGYYLPTVETFVVSNQAQTGTWQSIGASTGSVTKQVFSSWIEHPLVAGKGTVDSSYQYVVFPGLELSDFKQELGVWKTNGKVIVNSDTVQGITWTNNGMVVIGIVFWKTGTINTGFKGISVTLDNPGVVLLKFSPQNSVAVTVADPTQKLKSYSVTLTGGFFSGNGCQKNASGTIFTFQLPTSENAGSSTTITCTS